MYGFLFNSSKGHIQLYADIEHPIDFTRSFHIQLLFFSVKKVLTATRLELAIF